MKLVVNPVECTEKRCNVIVDMADCIVIRMMRRKPRFLQVAPAGF